MVFLSAIHMNEPKPFAISDTMLSWAAGLWPGAQQSEQIVPTLLPGDAGHRRYCRLHQGAQTAMLVVTPAGTEGHERFLALRRLLEEAGVRVPRLYGVDLAMGLMLLEDLGDELLLAHLNEVTVDDFYRRASVMQVAIARAMPSEGAALGYYDAEELLREMDLFREWFVPRLLAHELNDDDNAVLEALFAQLVDSALEQPVVLVHRDFHSRNLMLDGQGELVTIDFQDAIIGPITYDGVSLLRDCYIRWRPEQVRAWALRQKQLQQEAGLLQQVSDAQYLRWFDLMGLQRHIKVLGIFARLHLRDGKSGYLNDLPLVIAYVREALGRYEDIPAVDAFRQWFEQCLAPLFETQAWYRELEVAQ